MHFFTPRHRRNPLGAFITTLSVILIFISSASAQVNLLTQGFEVLPFPPTGWSNVRITGPSLPGNWARYGAGIAPVQTPHTGSWQVRFNSHNYGTGTSGDLRTSVLDFSVAGIYTVSFWMYRDNWVANYKMEVFVNTVQTSVGGTLLGTINRDRAQSPTAPANGWYQYTFTVPVAFNTSVNYIIFKGTSAMGNDIYMDDISVDRLAPAPPGCITTFSPASGTTGACINETMAWDIVALASGYKISVGSNAPDYNNVANNSDIGVALTYSNMLSTSTTYGWKITPYNAYGEAAGCPTNTFTTGTGVCYCIPVYLDGSCGSEDYIDDFSTTGGITNITNNNTGCTTNPNNYTYFSAKTVTAQWGTSFNVSMQSGPDFAEGYAIYIDWNIDGDFDDAGEYAYNSGYASTEIFNGSVTVPYSAIPGTTRLRVRCAYNYVPAAGQACMTFNEGEIEDYNIIVNTCAVTTYYADADSDMYGNPGSTTPSCWGIPSGYVVNNLDCNDADSGINPLGTEVCNGIDEDCDGTADDGLTFINYFVDADGDTYGDNAASPLSACAAITGYVVNNLDCNDATNAINPGASEICNAIDDNCNGTAEEGLTFINYYTDADGDAFGSTAASPVSLCGDVAGMAPNNTDCNDVNSTIYPGATELCNGIDENCNGTADDGAATAVITPSGALSFCKGGSVTLQANEGAGYSYHWYKNGHSMAGVTASYITVNGAGSYTVKVTLPGGCFTTSAPAVVSTYANPSAFITAVDGLDFCGHTQLKLKANTGAGYTYQWYKGATPLAGATAIAYFATVSGNYRVLVTNTYGCAKMSTYVTLVKTCRDAGEVLSEGLAVQPNPANDIVSVTLNAGAPSGSKVTMQITDISGRLMIAQTGTITDGSFTGSADVSALASGIYLIRLSTEDKTFTEQLVISR